MTTGEEGITSDLMVELWGSGGTAEEPGWASAGASDAAAAGLLSSWMLAEGSHPF